MAVLAALSRRLDTICACPRLIAQPGIRWPENVTPLHLPPYSPELNGIERVWLYLKESVLSHRVFKDMTAIIDVCCEAGNSLLAETGRIRSLANMPWLKRVKSS